MQAVLAEQFGESQSTSSGGGVDEIAGLPELASWVIRPRTDLRYQGGRMSPKGRTSSFCRS